MRLSVKSTLVMVAMSMLLGCKGSPAEDKVETVQGAVIPDETTPIGRKWRELINRGINLGEATDVVQTTPGGAAQYQRFPGAVIVHTVDYGAVYMPPQIFDKWLSLQTMTDANGAAVFGLFGVPIADYVATPGWSSTTFERGMIFVSPGTAHVVYGGIYTRYLTLKDVLGAPINEESTIVPNTRSQSFGGGQIHWNGEMAFVVRHGPVLDRLNAIGGIATVGLPISDSGPIQAPDGTVIGEVARFQRGGIYYSPTTGAWDVGDGMIQEYERQGGPLGWLGFPIAGASSAAMGPYNDFQHGVLAWYETSSDGVKLVANFGDLQFMLTRAEALGNDCGGCGAQDLYIRLTLLATQGGTTTTLINNNRMPDTGDFEEDQHDFADPSRGASMVANSGLSIHARVKVYDNDSCPSDLECENEHLGTPSQTYNIDNLWGLQIDHRHETGEGAATISIRSSHDFDEDDFRGQMWWSFSNFFTDDLSRQQYADTFLDVSSDEIALFNPFNELYFLIYENIAEGGNCYGMSIESIYAEVGRSAIGQPIHDAYPDTQNGQRLSRSNPTHQSLYNELNVKQGYQLGVDSILWRVNRFFINQTHNPIAVFNDSAFFYYSMDYPTIGITSDLLLGDAHSLRPYRWEARQRQCEKFSSGSDCIRIYVGDGNNPTTLTRTPDDFIEIKVSTNEYKYRTTSPLNGGFIDYEGGEVAGGRMLFEPGHTIMHTPTTPFNQLWVLATTAFMMVTGTTTETRQITDASGRTMFDQANASGPRRWSQIRRDAATRIPELAPVSLMEGRSSPDMWFGRGFGATHTYEVTPKAGLPAGTPVEMVFNSGKISSRFSVPGTPGLHELITAHDINGSNKAIALTMSPAAGVRPVTWTVSGTEKQRWMEFTNLRMSTSQNIRMRTENAGRRLRITNNGLATTANLRYQPGPGLAIRNLGQVPIPGGESTIEPDGVGCFSDAACGAGQVCANGACVARPCDPAAPFGGLVPVLPSGVNADGFALSADGKTAYVSNNPGGGFYELYTTSRASVSEPFGALTPLTSLNTWHNDRAPWLSQDGLRLYYHNVVMTNGNEDLVVASRTSAGAQFGAPQLVPTVNSTADDADPFFLPGEQVLFFTSARTGSRDLYTATRTGSGFTAPMRLANVNSDHEESRPVLTPDGLTMYFRSRRPSPVGDTDGDIWVATRPSLTAEFGAPQNLTAFNHTGSEIPVAVSADACSFTFASNRETGLGSTDTYRLYRVTRGAPPTMVTVTLNIVGNGSVNTAPFNCSTGNSGTCSAQLAAGTSLTVWGSRQGYWSGTCAPNGAPGLSTDGVVTVTTSATCTVTFP